jgi:phosphoglucomutase
MAFSQEQINQRAAQYVAAETNPVFKREVEELLQRGDTEALNDRFYTDLDFGTGGLRGVIGGGYNRMNTLVVQRATQGLASYIVTHGGTAHPSAVIAYDSRRYSSAFALDAALVLCANGIRTYLFTDLRPTPELSFAVRHLNATSGIVVTASHNPPQYNGYKVYWNDGGQVVPPHDKGIIADVRGVTDVHSMSKEDAERKGLLVHIGKEVDDAYIEMIKAQALRPALLKDQGSRVKVVFTPLHGAGGMPVERALRELGVNVTFVEQQRQPDGNFPTVKSPNPEEASAMEMALALAKETKADLVLGTDPDSDRIGIAVPEGQGYRLITGNQLGALLADYVFSTLKELDKMPEKPAFIKTIVTTELQRLIAERFGARVYDTLTGFKYIAEKIREFETQRNGPSYILGGEESYGFLVGTSVRDKDAVSAAAMTVEMALYHVSRGSSVIGRLNEIYETYGYFQEALISKHFEGESGLAAMGALMDGLRANPPTTFATQTVVAVKDYRDGTTTIMSSAEKRKDIDLPSSNVIQFILSDMTIVTARPSGTEPKIKFYASCRGEPGMALTDAKKVVDEKIVRVTQELDRLCR